MKKTGERSLLVDANSHSNNKTLKAILAIKNTLCNDKKLASCQPQSTKFAQRANIGILTRQKIKRKSVVVLSMYSFIYIYFCITKVDNSRGWQAGRH